MDISQVMEHLEVANNVSAELVDDGLSFCVDLGQPLYWKFKQKGDHQVVACRKHHYFCFALVLGLHGRQDPREAFLDTLVLELLENG